MLALISAPRYPTAAQNEPEDPMVSVARAIIHAIPLHRRTHSPAPSVASTSTLEHDERTHLLPSSLKNASHAVRSYGSTLIKHNRSESRKADLKATISRPIAQEQDWWSQTEEQSENCKAAHQEEGEQTMTSVYSTPTWAGETVDQLNRVGAFEYDEAIGRSTKQQNRDSIQSFTSSERSYAFF